LRNQLKKLVNYNSANSFINQKVLFRCGTD